MQQNAAAMREKQLNVRVSPEEQERLEFLADHYGLNAAAVIRMLVKREYDAVQGRAVSDLEKFITTPMPQKKKPTKK